MVVRPPIIQEWRNPWGSYILGDNHDKDSDFG